MIISTTRPTALAGTKVLAFAMKHKALVDSTKLKNHIRHLVMTTAGIVAVEISEDKTKFKPYHGMDNKLVSLMEQYNHINIKGVTS